MLHPVAKAITSYLMGGFGLALLCASAFIGPGRPRGPAWPGRARRRSWALVLIGPRHTVLARAALGLATSAAAHPIATTLQVRDSRVRSACWTSIGVSAAVAGAVCLVARP